ncbi:MAG: helix-turn-helix domain-containing protein [Candidatus Gastranaerophilales bacterium]|nr:helix-turn-helix domain-containing protein [Candidatus Gastranaerophilales bacterium]
MSNDFVNRLISIRKAYGKSGYAFSRMLNIPQPSYLRYETGEQKPSAKLLIGLNKFCNVNINWLLTGQGEQFLPNNSLRHEALVQSQTQDLDNSLRNWVSRLNIVLEENNLNYGDFANLIDISHKRLDNLTSKKELPNFEELTKIKSNFNVSLDWLLYGGDFGDVQANNSNSLLTEEEIDAFKNVINKLNQSYLSTFSAKDMKKLKV